MWFVYANSAICGQWSPQYASLPYLPRIPPPMHSKTLRFVRAQSSGTHVAHRLAVPSQWADQYCNINAIPK